MKRKVGLALGGGGARGAVHIGVLMAFEEMGIVPDLVAGTSVGALIATLLAAGVEVAQMKKLFEQFGITSLYSFPGSVPALTKMDRFGDMLAELIGRPQFTDLQMPLAMVATNLVTKKEVILDEGDVTSALQASMAFPILLPPVKREGLVLMDGGLVNNVPFDVVRARGATQVIAVSLGNAAPYGALPPPVESGSLFERLLDVTKRRPTMQIITAVTDVVTSRAVQARLAISSPDILLEPTIGTIGLLDFQALEEGIERGYAAVREREGDLRRLLGL